MGTSHAEARFKGGMLGISRDGRGTSEPSSGHESWPPTPGRSAYRQRPRPRTNPYDAPTLVHATLPTPPAPRHRRRIPRPPIPRLPLSIRERLVGRRSLFFIGLMLMRAVWLCLDTVRTVREPQFAVIGGAIFVMAVVIASPDRRVRAPAVGILCALIWSYALSGGETLDSPALRGWPILIVVAILAATVELAYSHIARLLYPREGELRSPAAHQLSWAVVALQTIGAWLFVAPVAFVVLEAMVRYGLGNRALFELVPLAVSLPPVVGVGVYLVFVIRRLRELHTMPVDL
jgi:hypothetical protein